MFASRKSTSNSSNEATSILLRVHYIDSRSTGRHYIYTMLAFKARKRGLFWCSYAAVAMRPQLSWDALKKDLRFFLSYRF